ncbi:MAG: hypothetical protein ACRDZ5_05025 [Acidimicrobiales bacterium]
MLEPRAAGRVGPGGVAKARRFSAPARGTPVAVLVLAVVMVLGGGAAGITVALSAAGRTGAARGPATSPSTGPVRAACTAPAPSYGGPAPRRLGAWRFEVKVAGTFGRLVSGQGGSYYALQACGRQEGALRVVRIGRGGHVMAVSRLFPKAALLPSDLADGGAAVVLGAAYLDLSSAATEPPYRLEIYLLNPRTLALTARRSIGRGIGIELAALEPKRAGHRVEVLAATGGSLVALTTRHGAPKLKTLDDFRPFVIQHLVIDNERGLAVLSLFRPGASPPAVTTAVAVFDIAERRVVAEEDLGPGTSIQSLAIAGGRLVLAGGDSPATAVWLLELPSLDEPHASLAMAALLESVGLSANRDIAIVRAETELACIDVSTNRVVASTRPAGDPPTLVGTMVPDKQVKGAYLAVTTSGIGEIEAPATCA